MGIKKELLKFRVVSNMVQKRVSNDLYRQNRDVVKKLESLKDIHKGERCFIIGTGPSLTIADLEKLHDEYTFGTNRIYELFCKTTWRPTYYVNQDHTLIKELYTKIDAIEAELKFIPVDYRNLLSGDNYRYFVLRHKDFFPNRAPFSFDPSKFIAQGFTVTYGAIQIAVYMGFKEIYLLGVDHNYSVYRDSKGHSIKQKKKANNYSKYISDLVLPNNLPRIEETTIAYETAEVITKKMGIKVYNATRGGKLEAFERRDFDSLF